jgi:hypothetical protein
MAGRRGTPSSARRSSRRSLTGIGRGHAGQSGEVLKIVHAETVGIRVPLRTCCCPAQSRYSCRACAALIGTAAATCSHEAPARTAADPDLAALVVTGQNLGGRKPDRDLVRAAAPLTATPGEVHGSARAAGSSDVPASTRLHSWRCRTRREAGFCGGAGLSSDVVSVSRLGVVGGAGRRPAGS